MQPNVLGEGLSVWGVGERLKAQCTFFQAWLSLPHLSLSLCLSAQGLCSGLHAHAQR
jgi:hypothetical protein